MQDTLILATYGDVHSAAVAWALRRCGGQAALWYGCEFPRRQAVSIAIGPRHRALHLRDDAGLLVDGSRIGAVWNRRPQGPVLPPGLHPADAPVAAGECRRMSAAVLAELESDAFWVNPSAQALRANNKPWQLTQARAAGLAIPDTLFSNDPAAIRAFHARHGGDIVFKPFLQPAWQTDEANLVYFTQVLPASALDNAFSLRNCPGIYQPRIEKAFEIRVTLMGEQVVAAAIASQSQACSRLDWREDMLQQCPVELIALPPAVAAACKRLMRRLGLVFGCMDLIVTPEGEHLFLEVNEMGQFLWIEERCPSSGLLRSFTEMLLQKRPDFAPDAHAGLDLSFGAFLASEAFAAHELESETGRPWKSVAIAEA